MADIEFGDYEAGEAARTGAFTHLVNWTGGLLSLALVGGLGVWGYQLLVRDVTGVPVVRALAGPMRVAPEDPGGTLADHQGLAVNAIAAEGVAAGPAEQVMLAPPEMRLEDGDLPVAQLPKPSAESPGTATGQTPAGNSDIDDDLDPAFEGETMQAMDELPAEDDSVEMAADDGSVEDMPDDVLATDAAVARALSNDAGTSGDPEADARALADALSNGVEPLDGGDEIDDIAVAQTDSRGLSRSPRPQFRPASLTMAKPAVLRAEDAPVAVQTVSAAGPEVAEEVPADQIAAGTRLVQLGAFDSAETARDQWQKISGRFDDFFVGKSRVVQRAESGGKIFYRLRATGFEDLADARRFCSALVAQQADCIPVVVR
ncbi:SPOR domain-containing protein [Mesobaculum littorinae]|uniref:SPOR domain-containing protein n=1 Tax=Mesobaculum littorinae TaxID=2486419 RepID=A0A438AJN5_9RHOB|nr:SPOR domain-containing protein [Mesobaculum littorinae]RVV98815.1 SPOR domain-containing protein [Mesobaculum littorinae]